MFDSVTGEQFYVKGIAYQPGGQANVDVLTNGKACERDVKYLKELGVNTVRVYGAQPGKNHDACMAALEKGGIYLMLDLPIPDKSIKRDMPRYDVEILKHYMGNVDAFSKYSNVLGFVAGNEVTNDIKTTEASAHIKAAIRDTKAYIAKRGLKIPVGYVDNDDPAIRKNIQDFFNCGTKEERADFYGINIYSWCGESSFEKSGYKERTAELKDYGIPVFLAEYGCNVAATRPFNEIDSIYGSDMQDVFSGGFVYEYSYEENKYGLVKINGNNVEVLDDYNTVKSRLTKVNPKKINAKTYNPTNKPRECPKVSETWKCSSKLPPTPSEEACRCAYETLSCRVNKAGTLPENGKTIGEQLGYICEHGVCTQVTADVAKGVYGPFSTCDSKVANSIIFNAAVAKGNICDFKGMAEKVTPTQRNIDQCPKKATTLIAQSETPKPTGTPKQDNKPKTPSSQGSAYQRPTQGSYQSPQPSGITPYAHGRPLKCHKRRRNV
ncbi:1 3-beta-glucanosyltransferase gel4 [Entomophthora muscae]|uniref:1 3-beta-glucanosyltransferase gel4 n=1 Tax=Entomophthora muscae TaxID=34485 RepID=A0ACC2S8G7_9FUNG|nr:1 3-beta-glucanosyltransferase gel4 [Entomophthora muscae]